MSILDKIKLTKIREVSALNKNQLEHDRLNFLKSSPTQSNDGQSSLIQGETALGPYCK